MKLAHTFSLVGLVVLAGCGEEFDPYNRLSKLRVLAVKSEPVIPAPGETTTLTPLVYTPRGASVTSYAWSWCPLPGDSRDGYPCLLDDADVPGPGYDLGTGPTASFEHTVDPAILAQFCEGTPTQPALVDCEGGFPVQIKLTITTEEETLLVVRDLRLGLEADPTPGTNPTIDGLVAVIGGVDVPIDEATLPRDEETTVRATVPRDREVLTLSWFVESGDTESERTGFIDGATDFDDAMENEWTPERVEDYGRGSSRIIVVVRDDVGGVGWREGSVLLEGAP